MDLKSRRILVQLIDKIKGFCRHAIKKMINTNAAREHLFVTILLMSAGTGMFKPPSLLFWAWYCKDNTINMQ